MSNCNPKAFKKTFDYPEETKGSVIAREVREKANSMTEGEREEYFKRGMQIIYGGSHSKKTTGVRH